MAVEEAVLVHVSAAQAVGACAAMAFSYVAVLHLPSLLLRLPSPTSLRSFMLRRFAGAIFSSILSAVVTCALLGVGNVGNTSLIIHLFGIKEDHVWQAVGFPLMLTCILYSGSLVPRVLTFAHARGDNGGLIEIRSFKNLQERIWSLASNILTWRNFVVAPITEEFVFRACMIPLLLCGGFRKYSIIFFSPVFFSLAHLNHLLELYYQKGYSFPRASMVVGIQLGYTIIFGWYAAFLFIRTGNLICPIVAHIFCNMMGLPTWSTSHSVVLVGMAFATGIVGFLCLLFPMTEPNLYNDHTNNCRCWQGYCSWG